jgi:hypothetical protein
MSEDTQNQTQPAADAPALSAGTSGLDPNQKLQVRQVKGATLAGFAPGEGDVVSTTPVSPTETTSARTREIAGPTSFGYVGQNLVDSRGIITRGQYDPTKEAYAELAKMDLAERQAFLNSLAARGLYGTGRPSATGFDTKDFSAMGEFLRFANAQGVTSDVAYSQFLTTFKGSGGKRVRTTAKEDIRAVFKDATRKMLGRDVSNDEIEKFVKAYEGKEITEGTGGVKAPSLQTAAEVQVEQQYGAEAASVGMLSLFDILDKSIKGLA